MSVTIYAFFKSIFSNFSIVEENTFELRTLYICYEIFFVHTRLYHVWNNLPVLWLSRPISASSVMISLGLESHSSVFVTHTESLWNMRTVIVDVDCLAWLGSLMWHLPPQQLCGDSGLCTLRSVNSNAVKKGEKNEIRKGKKMRESKILSRLVNQTHTCQATPLFCWTIPRLGHNLKCIFPFLCWKGPTCIFLERAAGLEIINFHRIFTEGVLSTESYWSHERLFNINVNCFNITLLNNKNFYSAT